MLLSLVVPVALLSSAAAGFAVLTAPWHARWTADVAGHGIQKRHHGAPPRIGLIPILVGCVLAWLLVGGSALKDKAGELFPALLACGLPAALMGLLEDITKRVPARLAPDVAHRVEDAAVLAISLALRASVVAFYRFNFPLGRLIQVRGQVQRQDQGVRAAECLRA